MEPLEPETLLEVLAEIERLGPDARGVLSFGVPAAGGIFVDGGRICWAAVQGLAHRLRDLVRDEMGIPDDCLDGVYERCRAEGKMLGEALVAEGWLDSDALEKVLRRHSAESLIALCHGGYSMHWTARQASYRPKFSFAPVDLLLEASSLLVPTAGETALVNLASIRAPGARRAAFAFDTDTQTALPIAVVDEAPSVTALHTLGQWALSVPLAIRELGESPSLALAATATGDTIAMWWRSGILYAVVCSERAQLAAVTAHHLTVA